MKTLPYRRRPARIAARIAATAGAGALFMAPSAGAATHPVPAAVTAPAGVAAALSAAPIVAMATGPSDGYWLVSSTGGVFAFNAPFHGSAAPYHLGSAIVAMAATPDGGGYWLATAGGGVFAFGDAVFHGSPTQHGLNAPVVGMVSSPTGHGYWVVTSNGGVFAFGDAAFHGSAGPYHPGTPIVGMAATPSGNGYWLVTARGGVFTFGGAAFHGAASGLSLAAPVVGVASSPTGHGYWLATADGGVFNYGDAAFDGTATSAEKSSGARAISIAGVGSGYWVTSNVGHVVSIGAPSAPQPTQTVYVPPSTAAVTHLPAEIMPARSIPPSASFGVACWSVPLNTSACNAAALVDIDAARAGEGYGALTLPSNYGSLSMPAQVLAVANAERTSRGLAALPENSYLDSLAAAGASADGGAGTDPTGPAGYGWGSNIAWGDPTALAADFSWMYDDGPGGENVDCSASGQPGCWGHRENILAPWGGASGAGVYNHNGTLALTELFVENY